MSTIAFRNGVLACDTLIMDQGGFKTGTAVKIWRLKDGRLYGGVGSYGDVLAVRDWVDRGMDVTNHLPDIDEDYHGIIINHDGSFMLIEDHLARVIFKADYTAIGTGKSIALGAMAMGATAEQAVEAAIRHDTHSGGEVEILILEAKERMPNGC